jgi:hypothetical protein
MDPQPLSPSEWAQIGTALAFLWAALGFAIIAGFSLLTAHAIITSLVDTNTISPKWSNLRPVLYFVGIAAILGLIACLAYVAINMDWIEVLYSRYWQ